ncbi:MAG: flagellar motor switch protein FliG [Treponema sp.]|nr:flagellar motor switch protein FliG [Treponema sp.]
MNLNNLRANAYLSQNKKPENDGKNNIPNEDSGVINQIGTQGFSKTEIDSNVDFKNPDLGILKVPEGTGETESVYRRVAKFLLLIGEEESAKILPHLSEKQIEKIVPEIASIRTVSNDEAAVILAEFKGLLNQSRKSGGIETAKDMLEKAYGKDKAERMLHKAIPFEGKVPFEYFRDADNEKIYRLLSDESVGVQSIVLSHLEPKKSAAVINLMNAAEKKDVVLRLAKMQPIEPDVVRRIDHSMHEKALAYTAEKAENIDGRNALAQILKKMDAGKENEILSVLANEDPDLGQDLRSRLFTIDDVIKSDDRFIEETLRKFEDRDICYLIAGKNDEFRGKILQNISQTRGAEILAQEEILKPMRRADCDKITAHFFSILRRAYEEGHLIIQGRDDDDVYV